MLVPHIERPGSCGVPLESSDQIIQGIARHFAD
jgi:hypothetical protein